MCILHLVFWTHSQGLFPSPFFLSAAVLFASFSLALSSLHHQALQTEMEVLLASNEMTHVVNARCLVRLICPDLIHSQLFNLYRAMLAFVQVVSFHLLSANPGTMKMWLVTSFCVTHHMSITSDTNLYIHHSSAAMHAYIVACHFSLSIYSRL